MGNLVRIAGLLSGIRRFSAMQELLMYGSEGKSRLVHLLASAIM